MDEKEVLREHASLLRDLANLEECLASDVAASAASIDERLSELKVKLSQHFTREEAEGYMASVLKVAPHLERVIGELQKQHRELLGDLDQLVGMATSTAEAAPDERFVEVLRNWIRALRFHESRENELLQEAHHRDIGVQD